MKHITLELSVESCQKALKELEQYKKEIKPKLQEVCKRLAEIGVQTARMHLQLADGNDSATIEEPVEIANGYKVVMSGEDVYFIEFGTGDAARSHGDAVSVPIYPGSYSEQHAQKYSTYGVWYYQKQPYYSTPAYMPMYYAGKAMREAMPRIVKEVFG